MRPIPDVLVVSRHFGIQTSNDTRRPKGIVAAISARASSRALRVLGAAGRTVVRQGGRELDDHLPGNSRLRERLPPNLHRPTGTREEKPLIARNPEP